MAGLTPIGINGAVIFWSVKKTEHDLLCSGLADLDLHDFQPDPRKPLAILKDALGATFEGANFKIDLLASKDGYSITDVAKGEGSKPPTYAAVGNVTIDESGRRTYYSDIITFEEEQLVAEKYDKFSDHITSGQVTNCLVKILTRLGGITLRPSGAVYWLPVESLDLWAKLVDVVEGAAVEGAETMIHALKVSFDESGVRAIGEGLVNEINLEADALIEKLKSDKIKDATLTRALEKADALRAKVSHYEAALGKSMEGLHTKLQQVNTTTAIGRLQEVADSAA